jgi:Fur family transcriptional regulator, ferric uptake regulator
MDSKLTRSQEKVLALLQELNQAVSAQHIYSELRNREQNMGLATVYRSLEALKLQGTIKGLNLPSGEAIYSLMPTDKHHLHCLNCGALVLIDSCPLHDLNHKFEQTYNFRIYYHTLEFFGLCDRCAKISTPD